MTRPLASRLLLLALPLPLLLAACGDEETAEPDTIACSASQRLEARGGVGDVPGDLTQSTLSGLLAVRRIAIDMGEVTFTPQGASEPVTRPRVLTFQTNTANPDGRDLFGSISRLADQSDGDLTFEIVNQPDGTFCDVNNGELCARFGLEDTPNRELTDDNIIHPATSGTLIFTQVSSTVLAASWDLDLGPNLANEFDESTGNLQGCFYATIGAGTGENTNPLQ